MSRMGIIITVILSITLLSISSFAAEIPLQMTLRGPSDNSTSENFRIEFIYGFNRMPTEIQSCTLWIDTLPKGTRQTLFSLDNNKISSELKEGTYLWQITCNLTDSSIIESPKRTITINSQVQNSKGYEIIYNNNGMRSYLVYASAGQPAVPLPGMKGGEEIRIRTSKNTHYIDLLKMGTSNGSYFTELRDRTARKLHKITVGQSIDFDFDSDKVIDAKITLEKTNNAVDAFFLVSPFPDSESLSVETDEELVQEETNVKETPKIETNENQIATEVENTQVPVEVINKPEIDKMPVVELKSTKNNNAILIALGLIGIAIIGVVLFMIKKSKTPVNSLNNNHEKKQPSKSNKEKSNEKESFEVISTSSNKKK